jgi:hypothetical protein
LHAAQVAATKMPLLKKAAARLLSDEPFVTLRQEMAAWRKAHSWIEDSALFEVARNDPELCDKVRRQAHSFSVSPAPAVVVVGLC